MKDRKNSPHAGPINRLAGRAWGFLLLGLLLTGPVFGQGTPAETTPRSPIIGTIAPWQPEQEAPTSYEYALVVITGRLAGNDYPVVYYGNNKVENLKHLRSNELADVFSRNHNMMVNVMNHLGEQHYELITANSAFETRNDVNHYVFRRPRQQ
jgi:hypothetical protein